MAGAGPATPLACVVSGVVRPEEDACYREEVVLGEDAAIGSAAVALTLMSELATSATEPRVAGNPRRIGVGDPARPALGWTEIGIGAGGYLALSIGLLLSLMFAFHGSIPTILEVVAVGVAPLAAAAIAISVRVRSAVALGLRRVSMRWILIGIGAGVGVWLVNRLVIVGYVTLTGDTSNPQATLVESANGPGLELAALLLAGAVLAPIGEELLFRGVLYGGLRRYGVIVATIASAGIFGLVHGINVVLPAAIIIGVVTAVFYEKSGSIWPAVLTHGVNNMIQFVVVAVLL